MDRSTGTPARHTVPAVIRALAARWGDRPLLIIGERRISYGEAEEESARLARGLLADGVAKGTRVGVLMPNGPEWLSAWLAIARIGAIIVPLNTFSRPRELAWMLRHADVDTLLTASRFLKHDYLTALEQCAPRLSQPAVEPLRVAELPYLRRVRVWGECDRSWAKSGPEHLGRLAEEGGIDEALLREVEAEVSPADMMSIIYSSGSTADPKGAVHTQGSVLRYASAMVAVRDLRPDDRIYAGMPLFWVGGLVYGLITPMLAGACVLTDEVFEPGKALELLEGESATVVLGWPHAARAMAEHPSFEDRDLSALRAGNLHAILPEPLRTDDPELRHNPLGMTETLGPHSFDDLNVELPEKLRGSFGRPVPGVEHRVVDPETGARVPSGTEGEICVRGTSLMLGLYKREREETFDDDGFYHTGDAGRFDAEGYLYFSGRLSGMIKTAGANVAPREVELALEALPEVSEAFVLGVPDAERGELVAAAVVLGEGQSVSPDGLIQGIRKDLSAYKVPRLMRTFERGQIPFLDSGKVDLRSLQRILSESREDP